MGIIADDTKRQHDQAADRLTPRLGHPRPNSFQSGIGVISGWVWEGGEVAGTCMVDDFPSPGETVRLTWQQTNQNFVITGVD